MRIIGQLVCGGGEADRYLEATLKEFQRLCDDVVVCLCNAGTKEKIMVTSYGFRSYEDNREWGKKQPDIKTELLQRILQLDPDWILPLDADETLPSITSRAMLESLTIGREACQLYVVNLWNDENHYARALGFFNVRFYKNLRNMMETQFLRKNVHCGNAPPYFYAIPARFSFVPHILLHKGLMDRDNRNRKVERYAVYDPNAVFKGQQYYDSLKVEASGSEYKQDEVIIKITEEINKYGFKKTN